MEDRIPTCFIGNRDPYEWLLSDDGKSTVMPELLKGCEKIVYDGESEVKCIRIESFIRRRHNAFDFNVKKDDIADSIHKIMEWALENEEYEMCSRIKKIEDSIHEKNEF